MLDLSPAEWTAVELSLRIAIVATACALPFGIAIGWLLARKNFWGKTLLDGLVFLPLVLPPVVTGYLLLISFGRRGPIGAFLYDHFGIVFSFRWTGAALACGVMGFPLMVRPIRLALEAIDRRLEDAAATLGANHLLVFLTVTLPLALPGVIAGVRVVLRPRARRVRRHHHFRLQYSRRDADDFGGDLHLHPSSRRRRGGGTAGAGRDRAGACGADRLRMAGAARRHPLPRGMIVLAVDVEKQLGAFKLSVRFEAAGGATALFGPSGAGKTSRRQHDRRPARAGSRLDRAR